MDAPQISDDLEVRQTGTPEAHLRVLYEALRAWVPKISAALLTPHDEPPSVMVTYRHAGPCTIVWDTAAEGFMCRGELVGVPSDLHGAVSTIAATLGAPVQAK